MALLTREVQPLNLVPVVVGGHAVEFYTLGGYTTRDVDVVISDSEKVGDILKSLGFSRAGRHWYSDELDLALEFPSGPLAGDMSRICEVVMEGLPVYVIGIEDLIIDRLNAFVHWKSARDGDWAMEMLALNISVIDREYLAERAATEGVGEALEAMLKRVLP